MKNVELNMRLTMHLAPVCSDRQSGLDSALSGLRRRCEARKAAPRVAKGTHPPRRPHRSPHMTLDPAPRMHLVKRTMHGRLHSLFSSQSVVCVTHMSGAYDISDARSSRIGPRLIGLVRQHPAHTEHLYNVGQASKTLADVVQMLYKCFLFAGLAILTKSVFMPYNGAQRVAVVIVFKNIIGVCS